MKTLITLAATAAVLTATPALADKGGKGGHGKSHKQEWKSDRGDHSRHYDRSGRDGDDRRYVRSSDRRHSYASARGCPPGLAKKNNGCLPPGQAKRMWREGQRVPYGYRAYTPYDQLPDRYVDRYDLSRDNRYIYEGDTLYQVDPQTRIVEQILGGLIR